MKTRPEQEGNPGEAEQEKSEKEEENVERHVPGVRALSNGYFEEK